MRNKPNRKAVFLTAGASLGAAAYNAVAAAAGWHEVGRSVAQFATLTLTLVVALCLNTIQERPTYAVFLRDGTILGGIITVASFLATTTPVPAPLANEVANYALGMTAGFAILWVTETMLTKKGE